MPTYNCGAYISEAIKSILNQTHKDFEFLIIDDGSTDNTKEIVHSFNDSRIRYIKKGNTGLSDSLNYGLKVASNDLIARMDADDIAHSRRIERQLDFLNSNPKVDVLSSWYAIFHKSNIRYLVKTPTNHEEIVKGLLLYSYISHPGCMYNRKVILKNGGYLDTVFEDYELWLRIMKEVKFEIIPEVLIFQRHRKNSLSRANLIINHKLIYKIQASYYQNIAENFLFDSLKEVEIIKGWREYFYGKPELARKYWFNSLNFSSIDLRVVLGLLATFLPYKILMKFNELRVKFRISYVMHYFNYDNRKTRTQFHKILSGDKN